MARFLRFHILFIIPFLLYSCRGEKQLTNSNSNSSTVKLKKKYAELLGVSESNIDNVKLYSFIDKWYGVPYKYGGKDQNGIDCSGFVGLLTEEVFNKDIRGPSWSMADKCKKIDKDELREGDLVFFRIDSKKISHVGIYLMNNRFVHASTSKGVIISNLMEPYYQKHFTKAGRPL